MRFVPDDFAYVLLTKNGFLFMLLQVTVGMVLFKRYFPIFRDKKANKVKFRKLNEGLLWWFVGVALMITSANYIFHFK